MHNDVFLSDISHNVLHYRMNHLFPSPRCDIDAWADKANFNIMANKTKWKDCIEKVDGFQTQPPSSDSPKDVIPLTAIESYIKNIMNESFAKIKEEIIRVINMKFELLRSCPVSVASSSVFNMIVDPSTSTVVTREERMQPSCIMESSQHNDPYQFYSTMAMPSEGQGLLNNSTFESVSTDVSKNSQTSSMTLSDHTSVSSFKTNEKFQKVSPNSSGSLGESSYDMTQVSSSLKDAPLSNTNKTQAALISLELSEQTGSTNLTSDIQNEVSNATDEHFKVDANSSARKKDLTKLVNDMMCLFTIIFESFKRIKEENITKDLSDVSNNSTGKVSQISKHCSHYDCSCDVSDSVKQDETRESLGVYNAYKSKLGLKHTQDSSTLDLELSVSRSEQLKIGEFTDDNQVYPIKLCDDSQKVNGSNCSIVVAGKINKAEELPLEHDHKATSHPIEAHLSQGDSAKILNNIKEIYLKNMNCVERKLVETSLLKEASRLKFQCQTKKDNLIGKHVMEISTPKHGRTRSYSSSKTKRKIGESIFLNKFASNSSRNVVSMKHKFIGSKRRSIFKSKSKRTEISLDSTVIGLLDISVRSRRSWIRRLSSLSTYISRNDQGTNEKGNLLKRLCFITLKQGNKCKLPTAVLDNHLTNIYNAICLDFVTDHVYKSVMFISQRLRDGTPKTKERIMKRWERICNKPLLKDKKSFNLECLYQIWVHFRTKICQLTGSSVMLTPNFLPALTFPCEDNRSIKEQVIHKYARDILEYISDPRLYKHSLSFDM